MPEYRVLLRPAYRSAVDRIPPNLPKQDLEVELHRALRDQEGQLRNAPPQSARRRLPRLRTIKLLLMILHDLWRKRTKSVKRICTIYLASAPRAHGARSVLKLDQKGDTDVKTPFTRSSSRRESHQTMSSCEDKNLWIIDERLSFIGFSHQTSLFQEYRVLAAPAG